MSPHLAVLIERDLHASPHGVIKNRLTPHDDPVVVADHFTTPVHLPGQRRIPQHPDDDLCAPVLPARAAS